MKLNYKFKEVMEVTGIILAILIISGVIPIIIGFSAGGFEETLGGKPLQIGDYILENLVYWILGFLALFSYIIVKVREIIIYKEENPIYSEKNTFLANSIGHDERDSLLWNLGEYLKNKGYTKKNIIQPLMNPFRLIMIFLVLGTIIGIFGAISNTFLAKFPSVQQQFTATGQIISTAEPSAGLENSFFILLVLTLQFNIILWFIKKLKIPRVAYWIFLIMFIPIGGLEWMALHRIIYGALEEALLATFVFGGIGTATVVLFGSIFPFWALHNPNNLFGGMKEIIGSNEIILAYGITGLIILIIVWLIMEFIFSKIRKGKKINPDQYEVPEVKNV